MYRDCRNRDEPLFVMRLIEALYLPDSKTDGSNPA